MFAFALFFLRHFVQVVLNVCELYGGKNLYNGKRLYTTVRPVLRAQERVVPLKFLAKSTATGV